jgi:hypothetical protein
MGSFWKRTHLAAPRKLQLNPALSDLIRPYPTNDESFFVSMTIEAAKAGEKSETWGQKNLHPLLEGEGRGEDFCPHISDNPLFFPIFLKILCNDLPAIPLCMVGAVNSQHPPGDKNATAARKKYE